MRVEKTHVFTAGMSALKGTKPSKLTKIFQAGAPINMSSRSLAGRVKKASVTKRGKDLSKQVGKILKNIPTPFLVSSKGSSSRGS